MYPAGVASTVGAADADDQTKPRPPSTPTIIPVADTPIVEASLASSGCERTVGSAEVDVQTNGCVVPFASEPSPTITPDDETAYGDTLVYPAGAASTIGSADGDGQTRPR